MPRRLTYSLLATLIVAFVLALSGGAAAPPWAHAAVDKQAPTAPTNFRQTGSTQTSVTLAWNASTDNVGVVGYEIKRLTETNWTVLGNVLTYTRGGFSCGFLSNWNLRARDAAGNRSTVVNKNNVLTSPCGDTTPPDTSITSQPPNPSPSDSATFGFSSSESGSAFGCSLDGAAFTGCVSPVSYAGLAEGQHAFSVRATDNAGNTDASPAGYSWTIDIPDTTPPVCSISSPVAGSRVSGTVTVGAQASDDEALDRVELYADNTLLGIEQAAPYERPWNTTTYAEGDHTLRCEAFDVAGNNSNGAVLVTVDNIPDPPPYTISQSIADGSTLSGTVSWEATTSGAIDQVRFYLDGSLVQTENSSPWCYAGDTVCSINTTTLSNGSHAFRVDGLDAGGSVVATDLDTATVNNAVEPPSGWLSGTFAHSGSDTNFAKIQSFETWRNRPAAFVLDYMSGQQTTWSQWTNPPPWVDYWAGKRRLHLSPGMWPRGTTEALGDGVFTLAEGASGAYDSHWVDLGEALVAQGQGDSIIRPGHEFTGNWYNYTVCSAFKGTTWSATRAANYAEYFRHIVTAMRSVPGQSFVFEWNTSNGFSCNPPAGTNGLAATYPGDAYVDKIGRDFYDRCFATTGCDDPVQRWNLVISGQPGRLNDLAAFQALHSSKQFLFSEYGINDVASDGFGDNPYFIQKAFEFFTAHDTYGESYFNVNSSDGMKHELFPSTQYPNARAKYLELFGG